MRGIYLGLGTNLDDRLMNLACCVKELSTCSEIHIVQMSSIYESEPYGVTNQPWFLNMVVAIETDLQPLALLKLIQQIEQQVGRKKSHPWGPRKIDIDILSYHNIIFDHPMLHIPHRQLHLRQFVLLPLKEIASRFIHAGCKKNIDQLLNDCQDNSLVNWFIDITTLLNLLE